jgi:hypothetical protein
MIIANETALAILSPRAPKSNLMSGTSNANCQFSDSLIRQGYMRKHVQCLYTDILLQTTQDPEIIGILLLFLSNMQV